MAIRILDPFSLAVSAVRQPYRIRIFSILMIIHDRHKLICSDQSMITCDVLTSFIISGWLNVVHREIRKRGGKLHQRVGEEDPHRHCPTCSTAGMSGMFHIIKLLLKHVLLNGELLVISSNKSNWIVHCC